MNNVITTNETNSRPRGKDHELRKLLHCEGCVQSSNIVQMTFHNQYKTQTGNPKSGILCTVTAALTLVKSKVFTHTKCM